MPPFPPKVNYQRSHKDPFEIEKLPIDEVVKQTEIYELLFNMLKGLAISLDDADDDDDDIVVSHRICTFMICKMTLDDLRAHIKVKQLVNSYVLRRLINMDGGNRTHFERDLYKHTYIVIPCSKKKENLKAKEFYLRNKRG